MGNSIFGRCGMSVDNFKAVKIPTPALTPFLFKTMFYINQFYINRLFIFILLSMNRY
ncbi:hypothetical protein ISN45_At02g017800 [Arabidopsis thaliana x Arabidopsis arenosa]|uniref:Uncharacterized protein At2g23920 n=2 Tax=Arabidopsis TaxID=3701 RepID=Q9SLL6_ARATH|nr:unknown protein [Arabidopsis thaliana]KAG7637222.1 hypothetical protein ISN45_At02g017800 [Arabidopsis thaliana x Arabidopsis arenosa]